MIQTATLILLSIAGAVSSARLRRLPNWLTLGGAALGLCTALALGGWSAALQALAGWTTGALLLLPLAVTGLAGPGDLKFAGAIGALAGPAGAGWVGLYAALAAGLVAFQRLLAARTLQPVLSFSLNAVLLLRGGGDWRGYVRQPSGGTIPLSLLVAAGAAAHGLLLWLRR